MDKMTNKDILERTRLPSDQKESPMDWTPHEDVTRQATKAGSLLSTVFWSHKERAPSSPVQRYHKEKPEAERHKDQLERSGAVAKVRNLDYENPDSNHGQVFHCTCLRFNQLHEPGYRQWCIV